MNTDSSRVWNPEGGSTLKSTFLDETLLEIDSRISCKDMYEVITRSGQLITLIEVFSDPTHLNKEMERQLSYSSGKIIQIIDVYFNSNGSEDSRVIQSILRDANSLITSCSSPFTTIEDIDC